MVRAIGLAGAAMVGMLASAPARAEFFAFDAYLNQVNDFSITSGDLTATFSSASGPGTFAVAQPIGLYDYPVALGDYGQFSGDPLTITFSTPVTGLIVIPFGLEQPYATDPATMVATANTGQTVTLTPEFAALLSAAPQDTLVFAPTGPITSLTLTSSVAFAIASLDVPEPSSASVLVAGLVGVAALRRRAQVRAVARA